MFAISPAGLAALEAAAAACAALNAAYFLGRTLDSAERAGRRTAASVLALVSIGTLAESAALLALLAAGGGSVAPSDLAWVRAPVIAGAVAMAALVVVRLARR